MENADVVQKKIEVSVKNLEFNTELTKGNGRINVSVDKVNGTNDHNKLYHRDKENQHPIHSIAHLQEELDRKLNGQDLNFMSNTDIENLLKAFI